MKKSILVLLLALQINLAAAEEMIKNIKIEGNKRLQSALIETYIPYTENTAYPIGLKQDVIKKLYATGLFSDVKVTWDPKTGTLTVEVKENPQVNQVAFEDNEEMDDSVLERVISLKSRSVFTSTKVQNDIKAIQKAYRVKGFYLLEVTPEYIKRDQNRIDVIYKIKEGPKTLVSKINFIGNRAFNDAELRKVVSTSEKGLLSILSSTDAYDPDRVDYDRELLRRYYKERGYADFSMKDPIVELKRDKTGFIITYSVNEGEKYFFGNIDVESENTKLDIDINKLKSLIDIKLNQVYSTAEVEKNIDRMVDELSNQGYSFVEIVPEVTKNLNTRQVNLNFALKPGIRTYVNRINIEGNRRTQDRVIRRELRLAEGDALQSNKLKRSKDRLTFLDYFSKVDITSEETNYPDKVDLNVKVVEQGTGEFNIGAGLSSYEGLLATLDIRENNFLGRGQQLDFGFTVSGKRRDFNLGFTEPWFLGRELLAGGDLYSRDTSYKEESSYDEKVLGGQVRLNFPLDEYRRNGVSLRVEDKQILNVDPNASIFIQTLEGKKDKVAMANTFSYDNRDSALAPTKGYNASWTAEYSGFGGDINYIKNYLRASYNKSIKEGYVVTFAARTGYIWDYDNTLPVTENFRGGGTNLRGFARSGIGPRDATTDDALGGKFTLGHNVELRYPLPGVTTAGLNGILFWDGGIVTDIDDPFGVVADDKVYRMSVGPGIFWRSPLGPLRLSMGIPIVKGFNDKKELISFSFGTRF